MKSFSDISTHMDIKVGVLCQNMQASISLLLVCLVFVIMNRSKMMLWFADYVQDCRDVARVAG